VFGSVWNKKIFDNNIGSKETPINENIGVKATTARVKT